MNRALLYLWCALLKRRALHWLRGLRRPTTLIGFAAVAFFLGLLFRYRHSEVFAQLVRRESLIGGAMVMLGGSLFKGFLQRGLVFELPDVQFLFTSPFTQRQVVVYRLLPGYLYAVAQALVFLVLFESHLKHPLLTAVCLVLFQIACFHVAAGAAIFAGTLSEPAHHRIRWMLLVVYFLMTAFYLRAAWGLKLVPTAFASPLTQVLFYPALTLSDIGTAPFIGETTLRLVRASPVSALGFSQAAIYLSVFAAGAAVSLWLLLKLKANIFETSLETTTRVAEKRLRLRQGRNVEPVGEAQLPSRALPQIGLFRGVGAMIWKNLVVACRSKRELALAAVFTLIYTGFLIALRWVLYRAMSEGGQLPPSEVMDFDKMLAGLFAVLAFLLQRAFPFDFRRDGHHLVSFRTLPFSPFALALAQIAVPTLFCLAFQALGILVLMLFSRFDLPMILLLLLAFPAVSLALNGVWNLHYLLAATKRAGGKTESASPVAMLMVVALSFLIFYPAGWTALQVGRHTYGRLSEPLALAVWLAVQYFVDFLLVVALARLFQRFEVSRDA